MLIEFTVPGKPVPKARARVTRGGWAYTPKRTKEAERAVRMVALGILAEINKKATFRLQVICYGADPRSDWDNLGKLISDALNGVFWHDDRQVIDARVMKLPCPKGQERTEVRVESLAY